MSSDTKRLNKTVKHVVELLIAGKFDELEKLSKSNRLKAEEIEEALKDYSILVLPPDSAFEELDVIEIDDSNPAEWSVSFDLWTKEGRSDLSLELTLTKTNTELYDIEIDNIHVL